MTKPNCYTCKYRRDLPGSAHSSCYHPRVEVEANDGMMRMGGMLKIVPPGITLDLMERLSVTANSHGIKNGWFVWPWNFDPVWLLTCDGFEGKDDADKNV